MAQKIDPACIGGYGRQNGKNGGLVNVEFSSRCPPEVKPNTRIIAVCGVNDYKNASCPTKDGWFFSDFYLFHHLFSGTGSNQIWLTCVDPELLVSKYKEYVHGNRHEMRRVVLDADMLPDVLAAGDVRIETPDELLCSFVRTVQSECRIATQNQQPVLILIFGHGDEKFYGVAVGGKFTVEKAPRLKCADMSIAIGKTADVTLIMTSCYSGGWVIQSNEAKSKALLNATMMTAAGQGRVSESWAKSESSGRAAGSIFASTLLQSAIKEQIREENGGENEDDIRSSASYAGWAQLICETGQIEVDRWFYKHDIRFASQNDTWGTNWNTHSGIPKTDYKSKWEKLRTIPNDISNPLTNRAPNANASSLSFVPLSIGEKGSIRPAGGFQGSYQNVVREQAFQYLNSFPGNSALGGNTCYHPYFEELVRGVYDDDYFSEEDLQHYSAVISYRMACMTWATDCKNYLDLTLDDAHVFDTWQWGCQLSEEKWNVYHRIYTEIYESDIFSGPTPHQGLGYNKGEEYLAIAFYESNRSKDRITADIAKLQTLKNVGVALLSEIVFQDPIVERESNRFWKTFSGIGKRFRSLSPTKKKGKSGG